MANITTVTGTKAEELKAKLLSLTFRTSNGGQRTVTNWELLCNGEVHEWALSETDKKKAQFARSNFIHSLKMQARKRGKVVRSQWIPAFKDESTGESTTPCYQLVVIPPQNKADWDYLDANKDSKNVPPRPEVYPSDEPTTSQDVDESITDSTSPNEVSEEAPAEVAEEEAPPEPTHRNGGHGHKSRGKPAKLAQ
jgi:hypothetical protein